jgi:type VI secretion system protein ImpA
MSTSKPTLDVESLLAPISAASPAGTDLRYLPAYDKIRTARRAATQTSVDDDDQVPAKPLENWRTVDRLVQDLLARESKDLQVAVWLLESQVRINGFAGAASGVQLIRLLLERYWDSLYPPLEPDDDEPLALRVGIMEWIGDKDRFVHLLRSVPLTDAATAYSLLHYEVTQRTAGEEETQALREAGWPSPEQFEAAMAGSPDSQLRAIAVDVEQCRGELALLEQVTDARFVAEHVAGDGSVRKEVLLGYGRLTEVLDECRRLLARELKGRDTGAVPGPGTGDDSSREDDSVHGQDSGSEDDSGAGQEPGTRGEPATEGAGPAGPVSSPDGAFARIRAATEFLAADNTLDPTPYLLSRATAFGRLYAYQALDEIAVLEGPSKEVRQKLRQLAAEEQWTELVQAGEQYLRSAPMLAWLDLHRYVLTALEQLGQPYARAAAAVRAQLAALLDLHPGLPRAEFSDGTPVANQETVEWIRIGGFASGLASGPTRRPESPASERQPFAEAGAATEALRTAAAAQAQAGRLPEALALLQEHVAAAGSGRERFMRRLDLAEICLDFGAAAVAFSVLDDLAATVEKGRLEDWESRDTVTRVWAALARCAPQLVDRPDAGDRGRMAFARLCQLDPSRAYSLEHNAPASPSRRFRR